MAMGAPGGGSGAISDINVTPLVDVMLVLLIIFMVTATLITPIEETPGSDFDLPVTRYNEAFIDIHTTDKMILFIGPNLRVYLGNPSDESDSPVLITDCSASLDRPSVETFMPCLTEIGQKLGQNAVLARDREIYIHADRNVPYGFVNGTLAHLRNAGVDRVGMITNPDYNLE